MPPPTNEETSLLTKLGVYLLGVGLGVGAKIATMYKQEPITWKVVIKNTLIAFAAAYLIWQLLYTAGYPQMANVLSVVCGRFADDILKMGLRIAKKTLTGLSDEMEDKNQQL